MNKLTMKIVGFDILTSSLHIKFASDLAEKDIEETRSGFRKLSPSCCPELIRKGR